MTFTYPTNLFASGSSFLPTDLANLECWYRADLGVTKDGSNLVSAWADQSSNSRDLSQGTGANQPLWVDAQVNSQPVIELTDTSDHLDGVTGLAITQPYHFFIVLKMNNHTNGRPILEMGRVMNQSATSNSVKLTDNVADNGPDLVLDLTNFYLVSGLFDGTTSTIAKNNDTPIGNANDLDGNATQISIGDDVGASSALVEVAEFFMYSAEITGADLTSVKNYINGRYSLW